MADILEFTGDTNLPIDPMQVLDAAKSAGLTSVVIVGYDADGEEYLASSEADASNVLWLLEIGKQSLLDAAR